MMAENYSGIVLPIASSRLNRHPKGYCRWNGIGQAALNGILPTALGWLMAGCYRWANVSPELSLDCTADGFEWAQQLFKGGLPMA